MTDDRLHSYLSGRAASLDLPPGDPARVARRATNRRHRRRAGVLGSVAAVAVVATGLVMVDSGDSERVDVAPQGMVVDSPLDWTVVDPGPVVAYARATAATDDGAVYALSTAPGATSDDPATYTSPLTLYRNAGGTDWEALELPADVWASTIAASGDRLYALGTAPGAAGGSDLVLASATGGEAFEATTLDLGPELEDLRARFPDQVTVRNLTVAAGPDGPVVAVLVQAQLWEQVEQFVVAEHGRSLPVRPERDGLTVMDDGCVRLEADGAGGAVVPDPDPGSEDGAADRLALPWSEDGGPSSTVVPDADPGLGDVDEAYSCSGSVEDVATHTWDEVGVAPDLVDLVEPRLVVLTPGEDGHEAATVDLPGPVHDLRMVGVDDGLRLVASWYHDEDASSHRVLRSVDGRTWDEDPAGVQAGGVRAAGAIDGALTVVTADHAGLIELRREGPSGWTSMDLAAALAGGITGYVAEVAMGPLGVAALAWSEDGHSVLLHSDGRTTVSAMDLRDLAPEPRVGFAGVTVTADAIAVRVLEPYPEPEGCGTMANPCEGVGDRATVGLVVGTPRAG